MDWNVKNAVNRDVERQHLNKILKDIRANYDSVTNRLGQTEGSLQSTQNGLTQVIIREIGNQVPPGSIITNIKLIGDVTGTSQRTGPGEVTIDATVTNPGIEEAPLNEYAYWRANGQWEQISETVRNLGGFEEPGFIALDSNLQFRARVLESTDRILITNGDGIEENPLFDLAEVPDSGTGEILGIERDAWGRVTGTRAVTTDDLDEGTTNLWFTPQRATDAVADSVVDTADIIWQYDGTGLSATISDELRQQIEEGGIPDAPSDGQTYGRQNATWVPVSSGGGGTSLNRATVTFSEGTGTIAVGKVALLINILTSAPARIRLYSTATARSNDASRASNIAAPQGAGLLLEFISTNALLGAPLTPGVIAHNEDAVPASVVYYNVQPTGASSNVTLTYLKLEN